jgi:hypothetical protein
MDTTSAVGGYADGVLGCTTDAGQVTIINGWNFYAGSDATQIASAQYDFETVVEHELGHALGLGHSTDSTSVMYATLNTGAVNRTLTTADLNVADSDTTGACGLHATGITMSVAANIPATGAPERDAFFALLMQPANAGFFAPGALFQSPARDAVFADRAAEFGTAKLALLGAAPIFATEVSSKTADDLFSDRPRDGSPALISSATPIELLDPRVDFIPSDRGLDVEC